MAADQGKEVALGIIRKARSPMWWARLSYPDRGPHGEEFWTEDERAVLHSAFDASGQPEALNGGHSGGQFQGGES